MPSRRASNGLCAVPTAEELKMVIVDQEELMRQGDEQDQASCAWMNGATLSVVILGGSGDLAQKKTFPALMRLFANETIPKETIIYGFGRTKLTTQELHDKIKPDLIEVAKDEESVDAFLQCVHYHSCTEYGSIQSMQEVMEKIEEWEESQGSKNNLKIHHRMFYFALPPSVYAFAALAIQATGMHANTDENDPGYQGFCRIVLEKPLGKDKASFDKLNKSLAKHFKEEQLYRIDHYLGKEMVQNLSILRFSNRWLEKVWNRNSVQCVLLTLKVAEDVTGRGGYFDQYGIIRDLIQNHLLQILCLTAMEAPSTLDGSAAVKAIRDAKVAVLNAVAEIQPDDFMIGQYEGYANDPSVANKESLTPTFAVLRLYINTPRWAGVPFIIKAGVGMDADKAEIRLQLKDSTASQTMFEKTAPRNEFVMMMQPHEAVYIKTNVKSPGFHATPVQSELEVNYQSHVYVREGAEDHTRDPYTRLILDVCRGRQGHFVREDEVSKSWEILDPILSKIDSEKMVPIPYEVGTRGPKHGDEWIKEKSGYVRNTDYVYKVGTIAPPKSEVASVPQEKFVYDYASMQFHKIGGKLAPERRCDIGLYGLAVMGQNFALNMAEHGFKVCVSNRSPGKVDVTVLRAIKEGNLPLVGAYTPETFITNLKRPRKVVILVQAGKPVDDTIETLSKYMDPGDVIIDGGNEWYPNSINRAEDLEPKGIHFIGMGISGGEEGARHGPSLMPGGPKEAYDLVEPIFKACAAQSDKGSCAGYLGPIGSGNYVKMVHNGIEYGDMQLIAEVYDIMRTVCEMSNGEIAEVFESWNKRELSSYLIEITAKILAKKDIVTGKGEVVDYVLDKTGTKGTGKWTVQEAAEKSVAAPTMAAALETRYLSGLKDERVNASKVLCAPFLNDVNKQEVIADLRAALYCAKVCSYAQGLSLIKAASDEHEWSLDLAECARLWTGGCIIRAKLLGPIQEAFTSNPDLANLMVDQGFAAELNMRSRSWRRVVALALTSGIACPSLAGSLTYFDQYRRARLPANLTQAQRDFFGGHSYERVDKDGRFHTTWTDAHKDIGDANQRAAGENLQTRS